MTGKGCVPVHDPSGRNAACDHATDAEENVQQEHATGEDNDIVYRKNEADPMRDALGSGRISDPDEWDPILQQLEDSGVEIKYRDRDMAYAPGLEEGDPGQIIIDPDAFLSALKHGYQHFLDAQAEGFPSLGKQLFPYQKQVDVIGDDPILYPCPCCRKKTLWRRGKLQKFLHIRQRRLKMLDERFKMISVRGRVSYGIKKKKKVLIYYKCSLEKWKWILEKLWQYTDIGYLDDWYYEIAEFLPDSILEDAHYKTEEFEYLSETEFYSLVGLYKQGSNLGWRKKEKK